MGRDEEDEESIRLFQVGDLVRLSPHLFPPEVGSTAYYSVVPMREDVIGIVISIKEPLRWLGEYEIPKYIGDGPLTVTLQYYEVMWLDGMHPTAEKHYDLELVSAAVSGSR
tara:strand:+ start:575 stop:907 length:333 start_codon:yes stop_codon:yes gene_type:complete